MISKGMKVLEMNPAAVMFTNEDLNNLAIHNISLCKGYRDHERFCSSIQVLSTNYKPVLLIHADSASRKIPPRETKALAS